MMPLVIRNSKMIVRRGEINFWFENWMGEGAIAKTQEVVGDPRLLVRELLTPIGWDITKLRTFVSEDWVDKILAWDGRVREGDDVRIWQPTSDGMFNTKSAWQLIQKQGSFCPWRKWLWHKHVPKKMSFICWRARKGALPVDEEISKLGIPLASKCNFCAEPKSETINHVLCEGKVGF